ncbi:MAG: hypothetical protein IIA67_03660 [Planctomycetes bacterium]|nr:hypothetical protein [Planctomycetota bacterium]
MAEQPFQHRVFLNYASADLAAVRELAPRLKEIGKPVWSSPPGSGNTLFGAVRSRYNAFD